MSYVTDAMAWAERVRMETGSSKRYQPYFSFNELDSCKGIKGSLYFFRLYREKKSEKSWKSMDTRVNHEF